LTATEASFLLHCEQEVSDRLWRLALHRMDLRQYRFTVEEVEMAYPDQEGGSNQQVQRVRYDPKAAEPDLESMISESATRLAELSSRLALQMWGMKTFERADLEKYDPAKWKEALVAARATPASSTASPEWDLCESGPAFVPAVCARDHWDEMTEVERTWCTKVVCSQLY
jgi:hypothetical protein